MDFVCETKSVHKQENQGIWKTLEDWLRKGVLLPLPLNVVVKHKQGMWKRSLLLFLSLSEIKEAVNYGGYFKCLLPLGNC